MPVYYKDVPWLLLATKEMGVAEIPGPKDNPTILAYYKDAGVPQKHEETAWCAAFVGSMLFRAGYRNTGSLLAKSYLKYGAAVKVPGCGDIVVFNRTSNPTFGHVGFFLRFSADKKSVLVLNGNVGDKVCESWFPVDQVAKGGYRRVRTPDDLLSYGVAPEPKKPEVKIPDAATTGAAAGTVATTAAPAPTYDTSKPLPDLIDDLRNNGSRTINGADRIQKVVKRFTYWLFGIGVVSKGVQATKDAAGDLGQTGDNLVSLVSLIGNNLWIVLPVLAFIVAYELDIIRFARADDEKRKPA